MTASGDRKEWHWLKDMLEAIEKIESHPQFANGKIAFDSDEHFRVWVFYYIERLGECASRLKKDFDYDSKHPGVDWSGTVQMRRYLVHVYWKADPDKVWQGVQYAIGMKETIRELLKTKEMDLEQFKKGQESDGIPFPDPKNSLQKLANKHARETETSKDGNGA